MAGQARTRQYVDQPRKDIACVNYSPSRDISLSIFIYLRNLALQLIARHRRRKIHPCLQRSHHTRRVVVSLGMISHAAAYARSCGPGSSMEAMYPTRNKVVLML